MTQDEIIIAMAREAGFSFETGQDLRDNIQALERFAALVAEPWIETNKALAKEIIELKKQAEQEPVGRWNWNEAKFEWLTKFDYHKHHMTPLYAAPQPVKQEPVGMTWHYAAIRLGEEFADNGPEGYYKFYPKQWLVWALETIPEAIQQPVRTKDLTDAEIADALYGKGCWRLGVHPDHLREYRRVIQADRELNK